VEEMWNGPVPGDGQGSRSSTSQLGAETPGRGAQSVWQRWGGIAGGSSGKEIVEPTATSSFLALQKNLSSLLQAVAGFLRSCRELVT